MAYPKVRGAAVGRHVVLKKGHRPCARCGRVREARPTTMLCADCVDVLTVTELEAWGAAVPITRAQEAA